MTELEQKLRTIVNEKETKILPKNLKKGITLLGVEGILDDSKEQFVREFANEEDMYKAESTLKDRTICEIVRYNYEESNIEDYRPLTIVKIPKELIGDKQSSFLYRTLDYSTVDKNEPNEMLEIYSPVLSTNLKIDVSLADGTAVSIVYEYAGDRYRATNLLDKTWPLTFTFSSPIDISDDSDVLMQFARQIGTTKIIPVPLRAYEYLTGTGFCPMDEFSLIKEFDNEEEMRSTITENRDVAAVYDYGNRWDLEEGKYVNMLLFRPVLWLGEDVMDGDTDFHSITNIYNREEEVVGTVDTTYNTVLLNLSLPGMRGDVQVKWERMTDDPENINSWRRTTYTITPADSEPEELYEDELFLSEEVKLQFLEGDSGKWNIVDSLIQIEDKRYTAFYRYEWGNFVRVGLDDMVSRFEEEWQMHEFGIQKEGAVAVIYRGESMVPANHTTTYYERIFLPYNIDLETPVTEETGLFGLIPEDSSLVHDIYGGVGAQHISITMEATADNLESMLAVRYNSSDGTHYMLDPESFVANGVFGAEFWENGALVYTNITMIPYVETDVSVFDEIGGKFFNEFIPEYYGGTFVNHGDWVRIDGDAQPDWPSINELETIGEVSYATLNNGDGTAHTSEISSGTFTCLGEVEIDNDIKLGEISAITTDITLNSETTYTIEYVATWHTSTPNGYIFAYGNYGEGFGLSFLDDDAGVLRVFSGSAEENIDSWILEEKTVYTFVRHGSTKVVDLYINGEHYTSVTPFNTDENSTYHINFNYEENYGLNPAQQTVHACRIIEGELSPEEILTRANAYFISNDGTGGPVEL